jgi:hypothetical protein
MLSVGQQVLARGYFTMLDFIEKLSASELERSLGFHAGRLSAGFAIVALATGQQVTSDEVDLAASSRWSGGLIGGREMQALLDERGQDVDQLKKRVCRFFLSGRGRTPAKVLPVVVHSGHMLYPDAEALAPGLRSGVPQFKLLVPKPFTVVRVHSAA